MRQEIEMLLTQKQAILERILASTQTQQRFVQRRQMKGLKRVLREREELLRQLADLNALLASRDITAAGQAQLAAIRSLEQTVLQLSRQVLREAVAERARIAAELQQRRQRRRLERQYQNPWPAALRGSRINERC